MAATVADRLVSRLVEWGVDRIYGYPGDGINGVIGALRTAQKDTGGPEFVLTRHEEMAAFMACAHAKFTGELGVCLATSGPGAIHLLNGLYDAKMDHAPVLAIVGQQARSALGGSYTQEVDLLALFGDVASEYCEMALVPAQFPNLVDRAVRIALAERTVTCLILPNDVQNLHWEPPPHEHGAVPGGLGRALVRPVPPEAELARAAAVLNEGRRVAILVGQGARGAAAEVEETANVLGAGIAKALLGKDVLPDDLPFVTGAIGLLGTRPSYEMMIGCDTLLVVGSSFPYSEFLPEPGRARGVQIDIDPRLIGIRYPMEVNLVGDAQATLAQLLPLLARQTDSPWREDIEESVREWWQVVEARALTDADPVNPQRVFWELSPRLPDACILTCDSGSAANWFARDVKIRSGMRASLSGTLASMGSAVPYAVAAKFAHPHRPVIALAGDGAMQMNGINELITISQYWKQWDDPRLVVLVLNNHDLNQVTWEQRAFEGDPKFESSQVIVDFPYARYAESLGLSGVRVDTPGDVGPAWDAALAANRPCVLEAVTDPNVPPIPPHVTKEQAMRMLAAIIKGDPDRWAIVREGFASTAGVLLGARHVR
jgi:pyruvate dehydrogenase (quinone)